MERVVNLPDYSKGIATALAESLSSNKTSPPKNNQQSFEQKPVEVIDMGKKNFNVEDLKNKINGMLLDTADIHQDARTALTNVIEYVLLESDNYGGYRYLGADDMKKSHSGTTVGINMVNGVQLPIEERFTNTDHTRVKYI